MIKKLFFLLIPVLLMSACDFLQDGTTPPKGDCDPTVISIRFHNTLDADIVGANFLNTDSTAIGSIPANAYTNYFSFNTFHTGDGIPLGSLKGTMNGQDFWAWSAMWCLTGVDVTTLENGCYTLKIKEWDYENPYNYQLVWEE